MGILVTLTQYMEAIEQPAPEGLGLPAMLGFPETGRTQPPLPVACVVFQHESYASANRPLPRLGQVQPAGADIVAGLYIAARNEQELLALADALSAVKTTLAAVRVDGQVWVVRYGETRRAVVDLAERQLAYVTETEITFSRKGS